MGVNAIAEVIKLKQAPARDSGEDLFPCLDLCCRSPLLENHPIVEASPDICTPWIAVRRTEGLDPAQIVLCGVMEQSENILGESSTCQA